MSMDPARLKKRPEAPAVPVQTPAPLKAKTRTKRTPVKVVATVPASVAPVPVPVAAAPVQAAPTGGTSFTGLDPLSRELVGTAPLIPVGATAPPTLAQEPGPLSGPPAEKPGTKTPTVLVALGGTVAAGLLLVLGFRRDRGHSAAAGVTAAPPPVPGPSLATLPTPSAWLKAGGA